MTSTALDLDVARKREHARPHGRTLTFESQTIPTENERGVDSVMPAGGAWSTVRDISRWLLLELGNGKLDGKQVVSEANLLERRKPRVKISAKQSYGLALFIDESRGLTAIGHGGNTFGFSADATFFPEHGIGFVMLTNAQAANGYIGAVRRRLVELLFDANEEAEKGLAFGIKQQAETIKKQLTEITMTPEAAFVEPVLGRWTNPRLGAIEIRREGDRRHPRCRRMEVDRRRTQGSIGRAQAASSPGRPLRASRSGRSRAERSRRSCSRPRSRSTGSSGRRVRRVET